MIGVDSTTQTASTMSGLPLAGTLHPGILAGFPILPLLPDDSAPRAGELSQTKRSPRELAADADAQYAAGLAYQAAAAYTRAQEAFEQCAVLRDMLDDPWGMVETLNALGSLFAQRSEFAPALEHFGRSLAIAREDSCTLGEANALNGSAGVYRAMGDPAASLEALHLCLPLFAQISEQSGDQKTDRANLARVFADMASCHLALEQPGEAIAFAEQARTIMEEIGDTFGVVFGYKMLGVACVQLAQIEEAIRYFHAALTTSESSGNCYLIADILSNLGDALMRNGQMELAMAAFACALAENNGHGQQSVYIETLGRLGALYARADFDGRDEGAALRYLGKAQRIGEDVGALRELCPIYSCLSNLHADLFERAGANGDSHHLQEALTYQRLLRETECRLLHEESDRKLRGLQLRYQVERAHREAEFLRCEAAIEQLHRAELAAAAGAPQ